MMWYGVVRGALGPQGVRGPRARAQEKQQEQQHQQLQQLQAAAAQCARAQLNGPVPGRDAGSDTSTRAETAGGSQAPTLDSGDSGQEDRSPADAVPRRPAAGGTRSARACIEAVGGRPQRISPHSPPPEQMWDASPSTAKGPPTQNADRLWRRLGNPSRGLESLDWE